MSEQYRNEPVQSSFFYGIPRVTENFQSRASREGNDFARHCERLLKELGFTLRGPVILENAGVRIEQSALNRKGELFHFEFTGCFGTGRPGLQRTDSTKKVLFNALTLHNQCSNARLLILTSHRPKNGSASERMIQSARRAVHDVLCVNDGGDLTRLRRYAEGKQNKLASSA